MPFFKSLPSDAGPPAVFARHPEIYGPWSSMSEALMNGPSDLDQAARELVLAYAAAVAGCEFVYVAHSEVAYARGIPDNAIALLISDPESCPLEPRLKTLLAFVHKLMLTPGQLNQADADVVFDAGWSEEALHAAIAVTARAAFMQRLVQGFGFKPMTREAAVVRAKQRIEHGYINLYPAFRQGDK